MLLLMTILSELVALGLGLAGAFQRQRKRLFALLGMACSIFILAMINDHVGFTDIASLIRGMFETQPVVHSVSSGNR